MQYPANTFLLIGAIYGCTAVMFGAFGAHGLKNRLTPEDLQIFETAVRYQFYHTFALMLVGMLMRSSTSPWLSRSAWCFTFGNLIFSGSLYLLVLTGVRKLGMVTPIGGVLHIIGWALLALALWTQRHKAED